MFERKLNVSNPIIWDHHSGGWKTIVDIIQKNFSTENGIRFVSAIEDEILENGAIKEPWVGFMHQVPKQSLNFPDVSRILEMEDWKISQKSCLGIWVLCDYLKQYLDKHIKGIKISTVLYANEEKQLKFNYDSFLKKENKQIVFIGEYLRNYQAFLELNVENYSKLLPLGNKTIERFISKFSSDSLSSVNIVNRLSNSEYESLFADNIFFLNLFDAVAVTTVIECISHCTPIIINKVGALPEYLGNEYPLFYNKISEVNALFSDDLLLSAHEYLQQDFIQEKIKLASFINNFYNSEIYQLLPKI